MKERRMLFDLFSQTLNEPELRTFLAMFYPTLTSSLPGLSTTASKRGIPRAS